MKIKATVLTACLKTTYAPFFKCGLFALTKKPAPQRIPVVLLKLNRVHNRRN
ncbi:Hypothetical protein LCAKO_1760 [Lacticaseibacillus paracasei subsp. paracasei]|uniref:Uncharacterized protein n=1 Tax=Lacticaseibacillus paracasei subsp. paracasei TaxID=47714 RepID=A0AAP9KVP3_LACPA|nr:Hypothetical protein LCAKO_1760 [Lacticaseibacillus paracasei subsp. paracasei]